MRKTGRAVVWGAGLLVLIVSAMVLMGSQSLRERWRLYTFPALSDAERLETLEWLGEHGSAGAVDQLVESTGAADREEAEVASKALVRLSTREPRACDALVDHWAGNESPVREIIAYAWQEAGPHSIGALRRLLEEAKAEDLVPFFGMQLLGVVKMGVGTGGGFMLPPDRRDVVTDVLATHPREEGRILALSLLAFGEHGGYDVELLRRVFQSEETPGVRVAALRMAIHVSWGTDQFRLDAFVRNDDDRRVAIGALQTRKSWSFPKEGVCVLGEGLSVNWLP